jgi:hypothetical protein
MACQGENKIDLSDLYQLRQKLRAGDTTHYTRSVNQQRPAKVRLRQPPNGCHQG